MTVLVKHIKFCVMDRPESTSACICDLPTAHGITWNNIFFWAAVSAMRALWAKVLQHLLGWLWSPQTKRCLETKPTKPMKPMKPVPSVKNSTLHCEGSKLDVGTNPEAGSLETRARGSIPGIPENWRNWWNWCFWSFEYFWMLLISGIFNLFTSTRSCGVNASDHERCGARDKCSITWLRFKGTFCCWAADNWYSIPLVGCDKHCTSKQFLIQTPPGNEIAHWSCGFFPPSGRTHVALSS